MKRLCNNLNLEKDKGYAWVIGVASFLSHFTHFGMSYGIAGNLTIAHQQFFNVNLQKGSLPGAVYFGCLLMLGIHLPQTACHYFVKLISFSSHRNLRIIETPSFSALI